MHKVLILLSFALTTWPATVSEKPAVVPTGEQLEKLFPELMRKASIPGLSAALLREGKVVWTGAFGVGDAETGEPVTTETVFEAASLSKPVFASIVMQLASREELDLDAPLWETLPYPRLAHDPRARTITPRMVLSHTAGLPNWGGPRLQLKFDPGTAWSYSGEGYVYLQKVLEKLTGLGLGDLARKEVFEPLGMSRSSYVWRMDYESSAAVGHSWLSEPREPRRADNANAAASLYTTASDYARFVAALLSGRQLSEGTLERMQEPVSHVSEGDSPEAAKHLWWGLGWGIKKGRRGTVLWHWGDNEIFRCFVLFYPASGDGLVYLTNSENGLSIAKLVETLFDDDPWAAEWLHYRSYEDKRQRARHAIVDTFLNHDFGSGMARLEALTASPDGRDEQLLNRIGYDLLERELQIPAAEVFRSNVRLHPRSANAWDSLAEAELQADDLGSALESLLQAATLDPGDKAIQRRLDWVRDLSTCRPQRVTAAMEFKRFEGCYGPRTVFLREDGLYYRRGGNEYALIPVGGARFALAGLNTFRIRFLSDEEGVPIALEGEYYDGRVDRSPRN